MSKHTSRRTLATLALVVAACAATPAWSRVAGGTSTASVSFTESTQLAMGWSVTTTLIGKTVCNDAGQKVGQVEDLFISPAKNVSCVIVGAGGFIGIGRHDMASPVDQIQDKAGKPVMAGGTKDMTEATAVRWKEFEANVSAATARVRKSIDAANG